MKTQSILISFCILIFTSISSFAQKAASATAEKQESIKVWGNCGMCKKTIETAAKNAGASSANWNTETKVLAVSYNSRKTTNEKIQQAIAASGYDTKDFTASNEAYNKLHSCCQYDRKSDSASASAQSCCDGSKCGKDAACCKDAKCCSQSSAGDGKEACADAACKDNGCCSKS